MEKLIVRQSEALHGTVRISGAKNAVLPILAACLLTEEPCTITNVPALTDVMEMAELLEEFGAETSYDGLTETMRICSETLSNQQAAEKNACAMRASFLAAGPLLARCHQAALPLPGGCPIGSRPVDLHLKGFSIMGAVHKLEHGVVELSAKNGLRGKRVYLDFPSVGATENIMMAATLAKGTTTIENAAAEPEICDLADFLRKMGAEITGDGTDTIVIQGQKRLHGATHNVISDRIEAGTFMTAAAITGGDILLEQVRQEHLTPVIAKLTECNAKTEVTSSGLRVYRKGRLRPIQLKTMPYPGFPTDMQPQVAAALCLAQGTSIITDSVWNSRFRYTDEFKRMGAQIQVDGNLAIIEGVERLTGAQLEACDLRAGAAMLIAALAAHGISEITNVQYIERGYEDVIGKIRSIGGNIRSVEEPEDEPAVSSVS